MKRTLAGLVVAGLVLAAGASQVAGQQPPQQPPLQHTSNDPYTCKACSGPLLKALEYIKKNNSGESGYGGYVNFFCGFMWLADGRNPKELDKCVSRMSGGFWKQGGFNGNWFPSMAACFLSEVCKRRPTASLQGKLQEIMKYLEANMEETGGWGHHLGHAAESGYDKIGGAVDLGILNTMVYCAMLNMKKMNLPVSETMFKKLEENLAKNSDGMGVTYGTKNQFHDIAMSRGAYAWMGLHYAQYVQSKLYKSVPSGLKSRYKDTHKGHAYPPLHFTSVPWVMHLLGPAEYNKYFQHWADQLIALQKPDGSIELPHSEGKEFQKQDKLVSSTACFALILILQQPGWLEKQLRPGKGGKGADVASVDPNAKPWLGFKVSNYGESASVDYVLDDSPAAYAGVQEGDLIVNVDGKEPGGETGLRALMDKIKPGKKLKVTFLRAGEKKTVVVSVGARPSPGGDEEGETAPKDDEPSEDL